MTRYTKFKKSFNPSAVSTGGQQPAGVQKHSTKPFNKSFERGAGYAEVSKALNCLKCRRPGHKMRDCPENKSTPEYCYNCGESEHSTKQCPMPFTNYSHALCFLCDTKGHLASACPKNDRGVYPNGGSCHYCGSIKHLARNCRPAQSATNGNEVIISASLTAGTNPEIDDVHEALQKIQHNRLHGRTEVQTEDAEAGDSTNAENKNNNATLITKKKVKKVVKF